ncbi:MAG: branched-chain amino acid ABC transporter ATP-binding protein/permease [Alphaproteobacteria bacterium]|nr:branched-chain amino acid ABC transporter ATP-binding protein/permease [Alphaproteobacteria bacterium]
MSKRQISEIAALLLLAAVPLVFGGNPYGMGLLTLLAIYTIALIGLDVTVGYLGQINLGQAAFMALGAYGAGLMTTQFGWSLAPSLLVAMGAGLAAGILLALPALRLDGPQFALATLSFASLVVILLNELEGITNGAQGLSVTRPPFFGLRLSPAGFYWVCLGLLALVWMGMRNLLSSHWGRSFEALRDSPIATDAVGVSVYGRKVVAFGLGSSLGALAGGLYAFDFQYVQPDGFRYDFMVILLLGVVLGGRKSLWGAFLGAVLIALLPNLLSSRPIFQGLASAGFLASLFAAWRNTQGLRFPTFQAMAPVVATGLMFGGGFLVASLEDWRKAVFALILFAVVVGLPEGVMGFVERFLAGLFHVGPQQLPPPAALDAVLPAVVPDSKDSVRLAVRGLSCRFGGLVALDSLKLDVLAGQTHGLIGPNGSGKSTAINVISGLYPPAAGEMWLDGRPLPRGSLSRAARAGIARTFQNLQLFLELTALENIMVARRRTYRLPMALVMAGLGRREETTARGESLALLELVGLASQVNTKAKDLPYGAQRFLEIARALACQPRLLILDEPAAGLSAPDVKILLGILARIRERRISVILIEHHMDIVSSVCDHVTVLDGGKVIASGTPVEVQTNAEVIRAYFGSAAEAGAPSC